MKDQFVAYIKNLQDTITSTIEGIDGKDGNVLKVVVVVPV